MRTLVYSNTGLSSWQIGINTEVIELLSKEDRELKIIHCNAALTNCYFNQTCNPIGCALCQSRQNKLLDLAGIRKDQIENMSLDDSPIDINFPTFNNLRELIEFKYKSFDIGRGPASSIVSYKRDYNFDDGKYQSIIEIELIKSIKVLHYFEQLIERFDPQEIYLFNGRFSEVWPLIMLASKHNITYYCIESGSPDKFELFKNALPHSIQYRHQSIITLWEQSTDQKKAKIGASWFEKRRNKTNTKEIQFTKLQEKGKIPKNFDPTKINIALYNSSEDELKAIQEWEIEAYNSQNEAIENIVTHFINDDRYHFYLRVHPNLSKVSNIQIEEIQQMDFKNLTVIEPSDPIDTYHLMEITDKVITFGSSTGIEATYWNAVSILFGKSTYSGLNATYEVDKYEAVFDLIKDENLKPKLRAATYPFGHYLKLYGRPTKLFKADGLKNSFFKGEKIRILYPNVLKYLFKYLPNAYRWFRLQKILWGGIKIKNFFKFK